MNEGRGTSANKTHLFNWLHNMSVQMVRRGGMCILNMRGGCVCVCETPVVFPIAHAFVCVLATVAHICPHN